MILEDKTDREFSYWDMYVLHHYDGLSDAMLAALEDDCAAVAGGGGESAFRCSCRCSGNGGNDHYRSPAAAVPGHQRGHLLKALALKKRHDLAAALRRNGRLPARGGSTLSGCHPAGHRVSHVGPRC